MPTTLRQIKILQKLSSSHRPLTSVDLSDEEIKTVQDLARRKLARDYADFYRRRTPVHLRMWGITPSGQAILDQISIISASTKRPQLTIISQQKEPDLRTNVRVRIRSPQPPEGLKLIPPYRFNRDKEPS